MADRGPLVVSEGVPLVLSLLVGAAVFAAGLVVGAGGVWRLVMAQVRHAETREREASDRLYAAWKDGYTVPAAAGSDAAPEVPELPDVVAEWVREFDPAGQAAWTARARRVLADTPDLTGPEVVAQLERQRVPVLAQPYALAGAPVEAF